MSKLKHKDASETVGIEVDSIEWASDDIHEGVESEDGNIVVSFPLSGDHKIVGVYAEKVGATYKIVFKVKSEPEP